MKCNFSITKLGTLLAAVVIGCWGSSALSAAGETYGVVKKSSTKNLFSIGNSFAGGRMYSTGISEATHKGLTASERSRGAVGAEAKLFGRKFVVILADGDSVGNSNNTSTTWRLKGCLKVMGKTVSCPYGTAINEAKDISTGKKTYTKTFFSAFAPFTVGPIPMMVSGNVGGYVNGSASAKSKRFNGPPYSYDHAVSYASIGAGLTAKCSAEVGIGFIASVGVTTNVQIVDGTVYSSDQIYRYHYPSQPVSSRYRYNGSIYSNAEYSVGAGSVKLSAKVWPLTWKKTIASWSGIEGRRNLYYTYFTEPFATVAGS